MPSIQETLLHNLEEPVLCAQSFLGEGSGIKDSIDSRMSVPIVFSTWKGELKQTHRTIPHFSNEFIK